ncbi:hypothetical protein Goarm_000403, partial [Gossypium armourianum]|nr:hypothetical protein [Gossypium armourianum]
MKYTLSDMTIENGDWNLEFIRFWVSEEETTWKLSWKFKGPQRVRVFIWLSFKQRLLTNAERTKRGIGMGPACRICGHEYENMLHVLRYCNTARDIWNKLIQTGGLKLALDGKKVLIQTDSLEAVNIIQ